MNDKKLYQNKTTKNNNNNNVTDKQDENEYIFPFEKVNKLKTKNFFLTVGIKTLPRRVLRESREVFFKKIKSNIRIRNSEEFQINIKLAKINIMYLIIK